MKRVACLILLFQSLSAYTFSEMMGSETARWSYVDTEHRESQLATFAKLYYEREPLLVEKSEEVRIPHTIHLIWLGPKSFPLESVENIHSWRKEHPDWKMVFWTDRPRPAPISGIETRFVQDFNFVKLKNRYETSTNWCEKSDVLRYEILAQEGGLYIDHDAYCTKNIDHLHSNLDSYCCLEVPHYPIEGEVFTVGIGVLGCSVGNPIMWEVIDILDRRWDEITRRFNASDRLTGFERVMHRTYAPMTLAIYNRLGSLGARDMIFPAAYFYPQEQMPAIYSLHKYGSSWNMYGERTHAKFTHEKLKKPLKTQHRALQAVFGCTLALTLGIFLCVIYLFVVSYLRPGARKK